MGQGQGLAEGEWSDAFRSDFHGRFHEHIRKLNGRRQVLLASACCRLLIRDFNGCLPDECVGSFCESAVEAVKVIESGIDGGAGAERIILGSAVASCYSENVIDYCNARMKPRRRDVITMAREVMKALRITARAVLRSADGSGAFGTHAFEAAVTVPYFSYHFCDKDGTRDRRLGEQGVIYNSFRPSPVAPSWRTPTTGSLATICYGWDSGAFPVLLDALEEAGADVGRHRATSFYKGNWLVDWVRGFA